MKANERDFDSFHVLCHVYTSFIPLVQLNVLSLSLLWSFIFLAGGGWAGDWCNKFHLKEVMSVGVLNIWKEKSICRCHCIMLQSFRKLLELMLINSLFSIIPSALSIVESNRVH